MSSAPTLTRTYQPCRRGLLPLIIVVFVVVTATAPAANVVATTAAATEIIGNGKGKGLCGEGKVEVKVKSRLDLGRRRLICSERFGSNQKTASPEVILKIPSKQSTCCEAAETIRSIRINNNASGDATRKGRRRLVKNSKLIKNGPPRGMMRSVITAHQFDSLVAQCGRSSKRMSSELFRMTTNEHRRVRVGVRMTARSGCFLKLEHGHRYLQLCLHRHGL